MFLIACNPVQKKNKQQETGKTERQTTEFEFTKEMHNFTEIKNEQLRIKY